MNTRTEITSNIVLSEEDKIKNVKYMIIQLHYHIKVFFYDKNDLKYCKFRLENSTLWTIEYELPLAYCFDYREIYKNGTGEEYEYYRAIFKDLKLILLSEEEDEWYINLFEENEPYKIKEILKLKNEIYKPILESIKDEIGDTNIKNLMFLLSEI